MAWNTVSSSVVGEKLTAAKVNLIKGDLDVLGGPMTSYVSTWAGSTTNPVIGNGSIVAAAVLANKMIDFRIAVNFGTSTTFGSGAYTLTLPSAPVAGQRFEFGGWIFQGGSFYKISGHAKDTTTLNLFYISNGTTSQVSSMTPTGPVTLTAASTNGIYLSGRYEAA
jgi:hypothetical protein